MKKAGEIPIFTFFDFMDQLSIKVNGTFNLSRYLHSNYERIQFNPVGFFVLDYRCKSCYYVENNDKILLDIPCESFMEGGIPFCPQQMVQEDLLILSSIAFSQRLKHIKSVKNELDKHWYSINYRSKRFNGQIIDVLQQFTVLEVDEQGYPLILLGYCSDISKYKENNRIVDSIYRRNENKELICLSKKIYFPGLEQGMLSIRETEILKWVLQGFSSKCIAAKLYLSTHTVNTHRRNMLAKTNAKNTADLLKFTYEPGLV